MPTAVVSQRQEPSDQELPRPGSSWPVDLVHLSRFTLGDQNLEHEVLQLFRVQARIYLERFEQASDAKQRLVAAHTIKGSARGIGAWAVATAAQAVEELATAPAGKKRAAAHQELSEAIETAITFIDELLAER